MRSTELMEVTGMRRRRRRDCQRGDASTAAAADVSIGGHTLTEVTEAMEVSANARGGDASTDGDDTDRSGVNARGGDALTAAVATDRSGAALTEVTELTEL